MPITTRQVVAGRLCEWAFRNAYNDEASGQAGAGRLCEWAFLNAYNDEASRQAGRARIDDLLDWRSARNAGVADADVKCWGLPCKFVVDGAFIAAASGSWSRKCIYLDTLDFVRGGPLKCTPFRSSLLYCILIRSLPPFVTKYARLRGHRDACL